jgi:uncharacterized SAM-binding protein YcdF (DUF218 family)
MVSQTDLQLGKILWDYHCRLDQLPDLINSHKRVIVGLGSYDLRVAEYCARLYLQGYASKIVFSGKSGNWTVGRWNETEAEVFAKSAMHLGVPASAILLEKNASNIGENIKFTKELLMPESLNAIDEIILVTKPNTTRRAYATFMVHWSEINLIVSAPSGVKFEDIAIGRTTKDLIDELVGDTERIINYPTRGYQITQEIPESVMQAYVKLKSAGYTSHCQS